MNARARGGFEFLTMKLLQITRLTDNPRALGIIARSAGERLVVNHKVLRLSVRGQS